jgi:hypothetical protein
MTYTKPQLRGYSAIAAIREIGPPIKQNDVAESDPSKATDPAYQADE